MAIVESIIQARNRPGINDDLILEQVIKANPAKAPQIEEARGRGADSTRILNEIIKTNRNLPSSSAKIETPPKTGIQSFIERFKLSFGGKESKERIREIEEAKGTRGRLDVGDVADIAGSSLPFIGGAIGATGGTILGTPIGGLAGASIGVGAGEAVKRAIGQAIGVREGISPASEAIGPAGEALATLAGGRLLGFLGKTISRGYTGAKEFFGKKTFEQIISTPEKELGKLSQAQRAIYFAFKNRTLGKEVMQKSFRLAQKGKLAVTAITSEIKDLVSKIQRASVQEVIRLRPKIISALSRQSSQYRAIVEAELSKVKNLSYQTDEVLDYVSGRFASNPELLSSVTTRLGIDKSGRVTVQDLYNRATAISREISRTAKQGTRVFTPEEKVADDTVNSIVDFLGEKGVDLAKSRQFWAKWAPIRDQLVREARPFNVVGTQTSGLANRLIKVAQGKDPNNENYISELERIVGEKAGVEVRQLISQLNSKQKELIATRLTLEMERQGLKAFVLTEKETLGKVRATATLDRERRDRIWKLIRNLGLSFGGGAAFYGGAKAVESLAD